MGQKGAAPRLTLRRLRWPGIRTVGRLAFRFFGCFCVTIAWVLILYVLYVYFSTIVPLLADVRSTSGILMFIPSSWLSYNLLFNYALVLRTCPGKTVGTLTEEEMLQMQQEAAPQKGKGWTKFCKHCQLPKPPRTHHCHSCGRCILKMDHHCPWINACVGHYNHRYFFMFVFYLGLSCLYACITVGLHQFGWLNTAGSQGDESFTALLFTFFVCLAVFCAMLLFVAWNVYLLVTNQTSIEYHYNRGQQEEYQSRGEIYVNPYDVGITRNLYQVFGPCQSLWGILLPSCTPLPLDGTRWLTVHDPCQDRV